MPNILIRDVPDRVHRELVRRADLSGHSLQQYLVGELTRLAERPTLDDVLARVEHRRRGRVGLDRAVADVAEGRSDR
jgi:antitoxin FitA